MNKLSLSMRPVLVSLLLILAFVCRIVMAGEQISSGWLINPNHPPVALQLQLTGETDPLSKTVTAVLQVRLEGDWKTYWRSPGDGGIAPSFDFSSSENIAEVEWVWPAPKRYTVLGVETLGYKGVVNFPLTLQLDDFTKQARLKGVLTLASCTNICVLSDYEIDLPFTIARLTINDEASFIYQQALAAVPLKLSQKADDNSPIITWHTLWDNAQQRLVVQIKNRDNWSLPDIFIDSSHANLDGVSFSAPEITLSGNILTAQISVSSWGEKLDLNGALLNLTVLDKGVAVELLSSPGDPIAQDKSETLLSIFIIALLGGLILNIMPCVLPVLGMKLSTILSAQAGVKRQQIRKQFLASSLGIVSSFWLLAAFLLTLKLSGQAIGWGIQFQSPVFISVMVVITALFAANMLGIFTIQLPVKAQTWLATRGSQSYLGHFLQGMFATLLATPCSAPFLGTAVAFSLAASALQLFIIFSALGLGMALPWLLIALFPAMALWLPKPGNWMNSIRIIFALLILLTCYWLLSLLTSFIGAPFTLLSAALLSVALLFLIAKRSTRTVFVAVLSAILLSGLGLIINHSVIINTSPSNNTLQWQPLDRQVIEQQVKQGNVVFVDITADWCITCKVNKLTVLSQDPVYSQLQEKGVIAMKGDWTRASDSITEYLQSYGRFGVPFNIVFGPSAPQGVPLDTLLTSESVVAAIQQAR